MNQEQTASPSQDESDDGYRFTALDGAIDIYASVDSKYNSGFVMISPSLQQFSTPQPPGTYQAYLESGVPLINDIFANKILYAIEDRLREKFIPKAERANVYPHTESHYELTRIQEAGYSFVDTYDYYTIGIRNAKIKLEGDKLSQLVQEVLNDKELIQRFYDKSVQESQGESEPSSDRITRRIKEYKEAPEVWNGYRLAAAPRTEAILAILQATVDSLTEDQRQSLSHEITNYFIEDVRRRDHGFNQFRKKYEEKELNYNQLEIRYKKNYQRYKVLPAPPLTNLKDPVMSKTKHMLAIIEEAVTDLTSEQRSELFDAMADHFIQETAQALKQTPSSRKSSQAGRRTRLR